MSCLRAAAGAALAFVLILSGQASAQGPKDYPIAPVPFTAVRLTDAFWAPRIETNRAVTIPAILRKCGEAGRIDNFAIAGGLIKGEYEGERYNDTDVYKTIEGASYSLMVHPDPELDRTLDGIIAKIAAAQEPDAPPSSRRRLAPGAELEPHRLVLIPYYAWAHRGAGEMSVWLLKSGTQYQFPN